MKEVQFIPVELEAVPNPTPQKFAVRYSHHRRFLWYFKRCICSCYQQCFNCCRLWTTRVKNHGSFFSGSATAHNFTKWRFFQTDRKSIVSFYFSLKFLIARFQKPIDSITYEERETIKHICYGILYGMGKKKLGEDLKVSPERAEQIMQDFMKTFPG